MVDEWETNSIDCDENYQAESKETKFHCAGYQEQRKKSEQYRPMPNIYGTGHYGLRDEHRRVETSESVIEENPILAGVIIVAVAAVAWVGISVVMRGTVDPLETGIFAVAFGAVYLGFSYVVDESS